MALSIVRYRVGIVETLTRQLKHRFGPLPRNVQDQISLAGRDQLEASLDTVLDALDLASVFKTQAHH